MTQEIGKVLTEARTLINGDRQGDYGSPQESFNRIATLWSSYMRHQVSARDVAMMMCLLKISRESNEHKYDNLLDAAGYIGLASTIMEDK